MSKRSTVLLDSPEDSPASSPSRRASARPQAGTRRDIFEEFDDEADEGSQERPRSGRVRSTSPDSALKLRIRSRLPRTLWGRIATGLALLVIAGGMVALLMWARSFLLHDPRFRIASAASVEIEGNHHLTRSELLNIFGNDIGRNIFQVSLADRQAELQSLPWVQHATLMRLLPGRLRVAIVERVPVAFVREGSHIELVDGDGVLLGMSPRGISAQAEPQYSFPVLLGILSIDPASTREARMKIYARLMSDLDSGGEKISKGLSEVDLSNPEDVKVLVPDHGSELLVHLGEDHFLERFRRFRELLPQWRSQYPNLSSIDMRYEREVVLDMANSASTAPKADSPVASTEKSAETKPPAPVKRAARPVGKAVAHAKPPVHGHPAAPAAVKKADHPAAPRPTAAQANSFAAISAAARSAYHPSSKPSAGKPMPPAQSSQGAPQ